MEIESPKLVVIAPVQQPQKGTRGLHLNANSNPPLQAPRGLEHSQIADPWNVQAIDVRLLCKQPVSQSPTGFLPRRTKGRANSPPQVVGCFARQSQILPTSPRL